MSWIILLLPAQISSAWFSGPRGRAYNTESYFWNAVRFVRGRASTVYRASSSVECLGRRCLECCACLVWASNQMIVAEKGTGLGRQVHGLSYKAVSGGVGGGFWALLRRVARRATVV